MPIKKQIFFIFPAILLFALFIPLGLFASQEKVSVCHLEDSDVLTPDISADCAVTKTANFNGPEGPAFGWIIVEKQTIPDGAPDIFDFIGALNGSIGDGGSLSTNVSPGTYTVQEIVPSGWKLSSIVCNDTNSTGSLDTQTATFEVESGETVTCTFTNEKNYELFLPFVFKD